MGDNEEAKIWLYVGPALLIILGYVVFNEGTESIKPDLLTVGFVMMLARARAFDISASGTRFLGYRSDIPMVGVARADSGVRRRKLLSLSATKRFY